MWIIRRGNHFVISKKRPTWSGSEWSMRHPVEIEVTDIKVILRINKLPNDEQCFEYQIDRRGRWRYVEKLGHIDFAVLALMWKYMDVLAIWPDAMTALNDDLILMGATHKEMSGEVLEYTDQRLKLIPKIAYLSYGETLDNVEHNMEMASQWIAWMKATGNVPEIMDVGHDVKDDGRSDQGIIMRAFIQKQLPTTRILVTPTAGTSHTYPATMRDPKPDLVAVQAYPHHIARPLGEAGMDRMLAVLRPEDGVWFPAFGGCDRWDTLEPGYLYNFYRKVWDSGFRGLYGAFAAIYERNGEGFGLYNHELVRENKSWEAGRTFMWEETKKFLDEV